MPSCSLTNPSRHARLQPYNHRRPAFPLARGLSCSSHLLPARRAQGEVAMTAIRSPRSQKRLEDLGKGGVRSQKGRGQAPVAGHSFRAGRGGLEAQERNFKWKIEDLKTPRAREGKKPRRRCRGAGEPAGRPYIRARRRGKGRKIETLKFRKRSQYLIENTGGCRKDKPRTIPERSPFSAKEAERAGARFWVSAVRSQNLQGPCDP